MEPEKEWRQMLREAWLLMRKHFWRNDLDWDAVYKKYESRLERRGTRLSSAT